MTEGWYYLHTGGDLIYKGAAYTILADFHESDFVRAYWPVDSADRGSGWRILVEALSAGANRDRIAELAAEWDCDDTDALEYADRIGARLVGGDGFPAWTASAGAALGVGDSALAALADLASKLGYRPSKAGSPTFAQLVAGSQ